jgi:hypothetical protein
LKSKQPFDAAKKAPKTIPEMDKGKVRKRAAFNQEFSVDKLSFKFN